MNSLGGPAYRLVSPHKGEYAGPCPFTGQGRDRFHYWATGDFWWCRKSCPDCPGNPARNGSGMYGKIDDIGKPNAPIPTKRLPQLTMKDVTKHIMLPSGQDYLTSRGITAATAARFMLGQQKKRVTIPNIITVKGKHVVYGIKLRWYEETPPKPYIQRYLMVPGSRGSNIFNWNRLMSREWDVFYILEGVLDTILLDQLGIPAVAPFGGGGVWSADWTKFFKKVRRIIIVADNDPPKPDGTRSGNEHAIKKQQILKRGDIVYPPGNYKDIGKAFQGGVDLHAWTRTL